MLLVNLGRAQRESGDPDLALVTLQEAATMASKNPETRAGTQAELQEEVTKTRAAIEAAR